MASVGFAGLGQDIHQCMGNDFNTYRPVLDAGIGFGGLPKILNLLRPFAITAEPSETFPAHLERRGAEFLRTSTGVSRSSTACPTLTRHVAEIDNDFLKHLIPLAEFTFTKPVYNFAPGTNVDDRHDPAGR